MGLSFDPGHLCLSAKLSLWSADFLLAYHKRSNVPESSTGLNLWTYEQANCSLFESTSWKDKSETQPRYLHPTLAVRWGRRLIWLPSILDASRLYSKPLRTAWFTSDTSSDVVWCAHDCSCFLCLRVCEASPIFDPLGQLIYTNSRQVEQELSTLDRLAFQCCAITSA